MKKRFNRGMTLAELMLSLSIMIVVLVVTYDFERNVIRNDKYTTESLGAAQDARAILRTMVAELRSAVPGSNGAYPIVQAATSTITFFTDTDDDGLAEQVRYFISTTTPITLKRGSLKPTGNPLVYVPSNEVVTTLAYNIRNASSSPMFEYFDQTYTGTSTALAQPVTVSAVRLVKINLLIDLDVNRSPAPASFTSQVMLRNLKDNL